MESDKQKGPPVRFELTSRGDCEEFSPPQPPMLTKLHNGGHEFRWGSGSGI